MSEAIPETPRVARSVCPGCDLEADPTREVLEVQWCADHAPGREGLDDARASVAGELSGSTEAGGEGNRRWCDLIHRSAA